MSGFLAALRGRLGDAAAVAAGLLATGMLRVAPLFEGRSPGAWVATVAEQFTAWALLCLAIVATITACERAMAPGWRRAVAQAVALASLSPAYAFTIGASPALTSQLRSMGLGETAGLAWYLTWFGWAIAALLSWYYHALGLAARAGTGLERALHEGEEARRALLESRLKVLEAQVEPRFLLDTLARVQALYERDPPRATGTLDDLIDYLRAALPQLRERSSTLGREMALVAAYLRIVSPRPAVIGPLDPAIESAYAPPMVLLPVVQAALAALPEQESPSGVLRIDAGVAAAPGHLGFRAAFDCADSRDPAAGLEPVRSTLGLLFGEAGTCTLSRAGRQAEIRLTWPAAAPVSPFASPSTARPAWRENGQALGNPA